MSKKPIAPRAARPDNRRPAPAASDAGKPSGSGPREPSRWQSGPGPRSDTRARADARPAPRTGAPARSRHQPQADDVRTRDRAVPARAEEKRPDWAAPDEDDLDPADLLDAPDAPNAPNASEMQDPAPTADAPAAAKAYIRNLLPSEMKVYGRNAVHTIWSRRPHDIARVYLDEDSIRNFAMLLKWCAQNKKAYHVVPGDELAKIAASVHHEGIVIIAKMPRQLGGDRDFLDRIAAHTGPLPLLYLDGVQNPHNVGSILRVAAHFGVPCVAGRAGELPRLTASALRIAEGGAEHVPTVALSNPEATFTQLRRDGIPLIATSSHAEHDLYSVQLPPRAVLAVGSEGEGMSPHLLRNAAMVVRIPGTTAVESLNVAVATGLLLGEFWRQHRSGSQGRMDRL